MQFRNNNFEKILASFVLVNSAAAGNVYPGDKCCTLYRDSNFEGDQLNLCFDEDTYGRHGQQQWILRDFNLPNSSDQWENRVSSYWCGKNVAYDFCDKYYGDCAGETGMSGAGHVMNRKFGHNDKADRIRMRYYDAAERGAAMIFRDKNCEHDAGRFYADPNTAHTAKYTTGQMEANHIKDGYASSIMVPYGYTVRLWTESGFTGGSAVIDGEKWEDEQQGMKCINLDQEEYDYVSNKNGKEYNFNDKLSSLEVYRTNQGRKAQGYWKAISASVGSTIMYAERTIYAGSELTDEEKDTKNYDLILDMNSGFDFVGFGGDEATISDEYAHAIISDTTLQINNDTVFTREVACNAGDSAEGVALWQFVVQNGDDDMWIETGHTVCRYGSLYNVAPKCPWNACDGSQANDCSVCKGDWEEM